MAMIGGDSSGVGDKKKGAGWPPRGFKNRRRSAGEVLHPVENLDDRVALVRHLAGDVARPQLGIRVLRVVEELVDFGAELGAAHLVGLHLVPEVPSLLAELTDVRSVSGVARRELARPRRALV